MSAAYRSTLAALVITVAPSACGPSYSAGLVTTATAPYIPDTPAYTDAARAFAATEPTPEGATAPPSDCETEQACTTACGAGEANACTRLADRIYLGTPRRAETLWLSACRARDAAGCARLSEAVVHDLALSARYGWHACVYGDADTCSHVGWALRLAARAPRRDEDASVLGAASARAFALAEQHRLAHDQPNDQPDVGAKPDAKLPEVRMALRISGRTHVAPTRTSERNLARRLVAKVCISAHGRIVSMSVVEGSGAPYWERDIFETMRAWRYRPFTVDDRPVPVCTSITFRWHDQVAKKP